MSGLDKRALLKRLDKALARVSAEIRGNASSGVGDSKFARGLASEGYAGGYADALSDVQALLQHGYPSDSRGYWRE